MADANQLLCEYAKSGSEPAFRQLVAQYVDLVFSVAVRRMGGDQHLARDVVQTVFTDLARKAGRLRAESSLGGWLHRHTCFVSSNLRRAERRRVAREQIAMAMNQLSEASDTAWQQLAPVLDEAIDELGETDRKAIVLRFYERRDLRAVGLALGTNEDAAQKRVSRALDKLRTALAARGLTLAGAALALLLTERAVSAAPAGLKVEVGSKALAAAGGTGLLATFMAMMTSWNLKLAIGLVATGLGAGALIYSNLPKRETAAPAPATRRPDAGGAAGAHQALDTAGATEPAPAGGAVAVPAPTDHLRLTILAADSGRPVPGVLINYRGWEKDKFARKQFVSNRGGICDVVLPRATITQLELTSVSDGFADTRLEWRTDRGETIPSDYTLRLARPVRISGRVVDADGQPVVGAKVGWNHGEDPASQTRPESHEFGWIEVETDADGRWEINRIAGDMIRRLYGTPQHPDYLAPPLLMVSENRQAEQQLRDGTHVFRMGRAWSVSGTVLDPDGKPVPDAMVHAGNIGQSGRRQSKSAPDGSFVVSGCRPGKNLITAEAAGFTANTVEVELGPKTEPISIMLQRGKTLRLRLVDKAGQPIPGANVWYNTFRSRPMEFGKPAASPPVQVEFSPKTDTEGRAIWEGAPEGELTFSFARQGFMRQDEVKVEADGQEHVITLSPALVVFGTVSDATTGQPIPKFRIVCGWPSSDITGKTEPRFSTLERFWLSFAGGKFRHSFEEPLIVGSKSNPGYVLKFQAEGYAPFVSRVIKEEEGEASLEVKLNPAVDLILTVLRPDGQAAVETEVGLLAPGRDLRLIPGGFSHWNSQASDGFYQTDGAGQVKLPPDDEVREVIASGPSGFAQATPAALRADPNLQLQAWGRLEGAYASGRRAAGRKMGLGPLKPGTLALQFDFKAYRVETDADGRFTFPQVPPGRWKLVRLVPEKQNETVTAWTHQPVQDVQVRPGETTSLTLGAGTRLVFGRVRFPAGFQREAGTRIFASIHTPMPKPPIEMQNDRTAFEKWANSPEIRALAEKARGYPFHENEDGTWSADEVPPGQYVLTVGVMSRQPNPNTKPLVTEIPVTVPEGSEPFDLGEVALPTAP